MDAVPLPQHDADLPVARQAGLQPDHRHGRRRHRLPAAQLNAAAPDKPFFLYYVPGGTHAPHQPTQEWIDKFKGKFDMGWNAMREQIFANQKRLGVIPADTAADRPGRTTLPEVGHARRRREEAVRAPGRGRSPAYVAYTDHEIGRVIQEVEDLGKLDNTLIIYISGDNGTSAEGSTIGTPFDIAAIQGIDSAGRGAAEVLRRLGLADDRRRTCRWPGRGRSTRRSSGPSRSPRTSAARARAWSISWPGQHQGRGRHPHPVPPRHRHRADDPRGDRHPGAGDGQRHRAEADRGRQHGLHLRQGERERAVARARRSTSRCSATARSTTTAGSPRRRRRARRG